MCQPLSPPPANVNNVPPPVDDVTSTRERFAQHEQHRESQARFRPALRPRLIRRTPGPAEPAEPAAGLAAGREAVSPNGWKTANSLARRHTHPPAAATMPPDPATRSG
ncbi:hypothetical protein [Sorangium sp. So ce296]|uniref:hypothetical protein n=1 Tax=Sorangium sp. So ce296 TaxID=3133296 RepID=UPI003F630501